MFVHPNDAEGFEWDDGNVEELARHGVTPFEVEEVFDNEPRWDRNKKSGSGDWKMIGRTDGGRLLTIIVAWKELDRIIRPISGWNSARGDRTRYIGR